LRVKNTFLEESPTVPVMGRTSTAPPAVQFVCKQPGAQERDCIAEGDDEEDSNPVPGSPANLIRAETVEMWPQYPQDGRTMWTQQRDASSPSAPFIGAADGEPTEGLAAWQASHMWMLGMWPPMMMPPMYMHGEGYPMPTFPGMEAAYAPEQPKQPTPRASLDVEDEGQSKVKVVWTTPARFLSSKDSHAHVSSEFRLAFGGGSCPSEGVKFKMMIYPKVHSNVKGGASFKKSRGRGYVELSCMDTLPDDAPEVTFSLAVGSSRKRRPTTHCFRTSAVGRLPSNQAEWDFRSQVEGSAVTILLYIEPCQKVAPPEGDSDVAREGGDTATAP
jgi:hypothetical protein